LEKEQALEHGAQKTALAKRSVTPLLLFILAPQNPLMPVGAVSKLE